MANTQISEFAEAYDRGRENGALTQHPVNVDFREDQESRPVLILPDGYKPHDLSGFLLKPQRIERNVQFPHVESFTAYVNRFKNEGTLLFSCPDKGRMTAILDYHEPGEPQPCVHVATLQLAHSEEWAAWVQFAGRPFGQVQFAEFLEDHELDVREPPGGKLLEIVKKLKLTKNVSYEKAIDLDNGSVEFKYIEDVQDRAKNTFTLPTEFLLQLRPFDHGEHYAVRARLRYDLDGPKVTFKLKLHRPDKIVEDAFAAVSAEVKEKTGITALIGG